MFDKNGAGGIQDIPAALLALAFFSFLNAHGLLISLDLEILGRHVAGNAVELGTVDVIVQ